MSDQVEIVAAEDAPSDTTNGEAVASAQSTSAQSEATAVESESQTAPVAEKAETEPEAEVTTSTDDMPEDDALEDNAPEAARENDVQEDDMLEADPLVDGPVGEVLDTGNEEESAETLVSAEEAEATAVVEPQIAEPQAEATESSEATHVEDATEDDANADEAEGGKSNVKILSVGQEVQGTVKRIADFGAFVDIGVGRDGLIHISELSVRRVGKVTDVLSEGQEVTAWIKKLDRDRNRISLTLIDPNTKTIRDLNKDDLVQGTVTRILPYGAFVDIGIGRDALLHVREMGVGYVAKPEDVVKVGDNIEARIIELSRRRGRVDLSLKGLREEPEATPPAPMEPWAAPEQRSGRGRQAEPEAEPEIEDDFEDLEVLSPMELAFKRAMEAEGMELNVSRKKQSKRNRRENNRSLQDEIIARTLSSGRK
jgi:small subunit ribosomal protein S1